MIKYKQNNICKYSGSSTTMDMNSVMSAMSAMSSMKGINLKDLQDPGFNPDVFKKLLEQQMEGLKKGKPPMMPSSWALGKPLTEEEFKKMRAEQGASVIKTVKTDGNKVTTEQDSMASGTIEEVLNRVREEKARNNVTTPEPVSSAELRKKLKARLQAKQVRRMSQHAVSSLMSKKMPQTGPKPDNEDTNKTKDTTDSTDTNEEQVEDNEEIEEIEEIEVIDEVVAA